MSSHSQRLAVAGDVPTTGCGGPARQPKWLVARNDLKLATQSDEVADALGFVPTGDCGHVRQASRVDIFERTGAGWEFDIAPGDDEVVPSDIEVLRSD